jgi:hypothetical protein
MDVLWIMAGAAAFAGVIVVAAAPRVTARREEASGRLQSRSWEPKAEKTARGPLAHLRSLV